MLSCGYMFNLMYKDRFWVQKKSCRNWKKTFMKRKEGEREESKHKTNPLTLGNGKYKNRTCTWENTNQSPHLICIFYVEGKQFLLATLLDVDGVCSARNVSYIRRQLKRNNTCKSIKNREEKKVGEKQQTTSFQVWGWSNFLQCNIIKKAHNLEHTTDNWTLFCVFFLFYSKQFLFL